MIEKVILCPPRFEAWCDAPDCRNAHGHEPTAAQARDMAKTAGWKGDGNGKCFCPEHAKELK